MIGIEPSTAQTNLHNIRPSDLELPATRSIDVTEWNDSLLHEAETRSVSPETTDRGRRAALVTVAGLG